MNIGTFLWNRLERMMRFVIFKIFHMKISEETWDKLLQFVKFGIVGLSNTVISYVIYVMALLLIQRAEAFPQTDYLIAQFIGFILSVLWSFHWNRKYVFNTDENVAPWPQALIKTYISYAFTGIFLNSILSFLWVQWLGVPKIIAPVINLLVSVPLNFLLNKFWAFRVKRGSN